MRVAKVEGPDLGILVKLVCGDVVDRKDDLDLVLLCLFDQSCDFLRSRKVEERIADLIR